jgi:hypothetical protein
MELGPPVTGTTLPPRRFGAIGSVVGLLALIAALLPHWIMPMIYPPLPVDQVIVETGHRLKERLIAHAKGIEYQAAAPNVSDAVRWNERLAAGAVGLGLLAIVLAVCSLLFREERILAGVSAALGVTAIAFEFAVVAIGALILIAIIYAVLDYLG